MPTYSDQILMTNYILQQLERGLSGRDEPECWYVFPQDRYHLGVLAPKQPEVDVFSQPVDPPEAGTQVDDVSRMTQNMRKDGRSHSSKQKSTNDSEDEESFSQIENDDGDKFNREDLLSKRGAPSAMGLEFMVNPSATDKLALIFDIRFSIYTRRFPSWEQQQIYLRQNEDQHTAVGRQTVQLGDRHIRHEISIEPFKIILDPIKNQRVTQPFSDRIRQVLDQEKTELYVWRKIARLSAPSSVFSSKENYERYLANLTAEQDIPPISTYLDIRTIKLSDGKVRVGAYIVNNTPMDDQSVSTNASRYLVDVRMTCQIQGAEITPIEITSAPDDYQYDPQVWVVGQGCATNFDIDNQIIWTEALGKYDQPRLTTINDPEAPFSDLSLDPIGILSNIYKQMLEYGKNWLEELEKTRQGLATNIVFRTEREYQACQKDFTAFQDETVRFREGIAALEADNRLLEAFRAMHRVFLRVGQQRSISRWRLFQIGFIVTQLPALAIREQKVKTDILNYADVLWFPTGGGKTEAYLGLICCALLYDRLRGKNAGVTAWLRFPLRMLSVQQLQRAIKVLYETEQERQTILGDQAHNSDPISLGYFVGKSSTPNQLTDASWAGKWKLSELAQNPDLRTQLRLVRSCPRCQKPSVEVMVDTKNQRIKHICSSCKLDLNIYLSDDEIYRYLPSVLIGTVDKLPTISWRDKFAHIWGGVNSYCAEHGYASGNYCTVYGCKSTRKPVQLYDPVPALQIQDELHLLREELGTFAGHYETLAKICQSRITLPPKVIAATATVEGLDRQTRHLYDLPARRFPSRGYQLGQSFYAEYDKDDNSNVMTARRFVAFKSPYLRPPEASARVLEITHGIIRHLYTLLADNGPLAVIEEIGLIESRSINEILDLIDKYDTSLTYVGSKAHGSRIERVLRDEISRRIDAAGTRKQLEVSYLNGESSIDDIANTIDELESHSNWDDVNRLDAVVGTSLISHGVDVDRFNLMTMAGMPGRTAEYIQASSRSGRKYVGIIVVVLSPWLLREQSFYHRFISYHYHMEHLVEPVPINRFSRFAAIKTMPGILAGVLNAYFAPSAQIPLSKIRDLHKAVYEDKVFTEEQLLEIVKKAYGLESSLHTASLISALEEQVKNRFKLEMRRLRSPGSAERIADALSKQPMTSLRDIDEPVPFEPKEYAFSLLRWISK